MKSNLIHIYGRKPIEEIILRSPKSVLQLYLRETGQGNFFDGIAELAREKKVRVQKVPQNKIESLVGEVNDQGVVATLKEFPYTDFEEWMHSIDIKKNPGVVMLDEIEDPHNVGAIIRTATALGVSAILIPKHRQAGINATVYKTSAGAVGILPVIQIGNVNQTIDRLKEAGFWIAGLTAEGKTKLWDEAFDAPFVFIVGSEGKGIRTKTEEYCDIKLSIPMANNVESLNASVAAALVCYEWNKKRFMKKK